jgi:hypothetical protein
MARFIEVSQENYFNFKQEVLEGKLINRVDIPVSNLEIDSLSAISFNGTILSLTPSAQKGLMKSMGVAKALIDALKSAYNDTKLLNTILNHIRNAKKSSKNVTLVYNKKLNIITGVYPSANKFISDKQFFDIIESLIAKAPNSYLRNITMADNGNLNAIIGDPSLEFQFNKEKDEVFTGGITVELTPGNLSSSFFTERKVCSNGMTTKDRLCTRSVSVNKDVPEFLQAILSADYHLNNIKEFKNRLNRCYFTTASLSEVLNTERRLKSLLGEHYETLSDNMSIDYLKSVFGDEYLLAVNNHKYLKTNISLWDLTNEVTAISSRIEQNNLLIKERTNLELQILGGNLMFKQPDLIPGNIKQIF